MTNRKVHGSVPHDFEGDLASLRGDGALARDWAAPDPIIPRADLPVSPSRIHGVTVPPASARLLDAMSDYGD